MKHTLQEAIIQGKEKAEDARDANLKRLQCKSITSRIFIILFNKAFVDAGFGFPAQTAKRDIGMLNSWITYLKLTLSSGEIANIAISIPARWKVDFAGNEFNTVEGKKLIFPTRPNLRVVLYCKNDVASFLLEDSVKDGAGVGRPIIPK